jgi:hypothetical protein
MNTVSYLQILTKIEDEKKVIQDKEDKITFELENLNIEKNNVMKCKSTVFKELMGKFDSKNERTNEVIPLALHTIGIYHYRCVHMYVYVYLELNVWIHIYSKNEYSNYIVP